MKWISSVLAFLGLMGYCSTSNAVSKAEFDAALKQADRDKETKAGTNRALPFLILTPWENEFPPPNTMFSFPLWPITLRNAFIRWVANLPKTFAHRLGTIWIENVWLVLALWQDDPD